MDDLKKVHFVLLGCSYLRLFTLTFHWGGPGSIPRREPNF